MPPAHAPPEHQTPPRPTECPTDVVGLAILVFSVAVGLALVLLATATFIQVVR